MSKLIIWLITGYQMLDGIKHQVLLSVFGYHSVCKHRPTCSQFAITSVQKNGTIIGLWQATTRFLTCW